MAAKNHLPRVFFDIEIGDLSVGRVIFELETGNAPKTSENFRSLCTGERGTGVTTMKPLHYKNAIFHRVVKGFMIQGGDFSASNGTGGESIYGGTFEDEEFVLKHDKPFLLSMANRGKDTNGSQFFVTTQPAPHLDGKHVVYGRVVAGSDVISLIENQPVDRSYRPLQDVKITNCGELVLKTKRKEKPVVKEKAAQSSSDDSSDSDSESEKKKKKKEKKAKKKLQDSKKRSKEIEEGEVSEEPGQINHPLASVTKIDPEEIPEVPPNKYLYRTGKVEKPEENRKRQQTVWGHTRSGRTVKGRGTFRYRTPSRSRSRSQTPPHWRKESGRTISYSEFEKRELEKRKRDEELKRREEARLARHAERDKEKRPSPPNRNDIERSRKDREREHNPNSSRSHSRRECEDKSEQKKDSPESEKENTGKNECKVDPDNFDVDRVIPFETLTDSQKTDDVPSSGQESAKVGKKLKSSRQSRERSSRRSKHRRSVSGSPNKKHRSEKRRY